MTSSEFISVNRDTYGAFMSDRADYSADKEIKDGDTYIHESYDDDGKLVAIATYREGRPTIYKIKLSKEKC